MKSVQFKICGLTRAEDARHAEQAGAHYGGVILAPGSPRTIEALAAAEVFGTTDLKRVGVFVNPTLEEIGEAIEQAGLDVLQLHGDETPEFIARVRSSFDTAIWKALRPRSGEEFRMEAELYVDRVDAILLDGWSREARGGTGNRFPWTAVSPHREVIAPPVALAVAGGLDPQNVARAIRILRPEIVDVSSGVEKSPGIKDPGRIQQFAAKVNGPAVQQKVG